MQAMDGRDRKRVERMCRYLARPPIAMERLTETGDGNELCYELKQAWREGTHLVRLDPNELLARIYAMVSPPRFHMVRFHGVLAPNSSLREQLVASAQPYVPPMEKTAPNSLQLPLFGKFFDEPEADVGHKRRKPWAWLLRYVFAVDGRCDSSRFGASGFVGARTASAKEGSARAALVAVCENASSLKEGRILRDVAHVLACAAVHVCAWVEQSRAERTLLVTKRRSALAECG